MAELQPNKMEETSTVKVENEKVTCATAEGSVINININQRSALDCMLDAIKASRMRKFRISNKPARKTGSALNLGIGVSFISVGFFCVGLAVILAPVPRPLSIVYLGTHFWVGFPFIVSGVLNVVIYRYPKPFWVFLACISPLACLAVSIAGLVFAVQDIGYFYWSNNECVALAESFREIQKRYDSYYNSYYYNTYNRTAPLRHYNTDNYSYELDNCNWALNKSMSMLFGLVIMSLLIMVWGICASVIALGYRLWAVFTACKCEKPEEEDKDEPLLSPNPPNDIIIA